MASDVLDGLLRVNLTAGLAVLLVLLLRPVLRRLAGAQAAYGLWGLIPLMTLAAFLPTRMAPEPLARFDAVLGPVTTAAPPPWAGSALQAGLPGDALPVAVLLLAVWGAGAAGALAYVAWRHVGFLRRLGRLTPRDDDGVEQASAAGLGPAVVGVFAPRIVVPSDFEARFSGPERDLVLAHERRHLAAGHPQQNALAVLARALCWFNPLAYLAAHLMRVDQELACDAAVVAARPDSRRLYAETLVKAQLGGPALALGCYWPGRSRHPMLRRVAALAAPAAGPVRRGAGAGLVAACALLGTYAAWAAQPPKAARTSSVRASLAATLAEMGQPRPSDAPLAGVRPIALAMSTAWDPMTVRRVRNDGPAPEAPVERADPAAPAAPVAPVAPVARASAAEPAAPVQPAEPAAPADPVAPASAITRPVWIEQPTDADYPYHARSSGALRGRVNLTCRVRADGGLEACRILPPAGPATAPPREALQLMSRFRMAPQAADGSPTAGRDVAFAMRFATRTVRSRS